MKGKKKVEHHMHINFLWAVWFLLKNTVLATSCRIKGLPSDPARHGCQNCTLIIPSIRWNLLTDGLRLHLPFLPSKDPK